MQKNLQEMKKITGWNIEKKSRTIFKKNNLEAKKKYKFLADEIAAHKDLFPNRHWSFTVRWNNFL